VSIHWSQNKESSSDNLMRSTVVKVYIPLDSQSFLRDSQRDFQNSDPLLPPTPIVLHFRGPNMFSANERMKKINELLNSCMDSKTNVRGHE